MSLNKGDVLQSLFTIDLLAKLIHDSDCITEKQQSYLINIKGLTDKLIVQVDSAIMEPVGLRTYEIWALRVNDTIVHLFNHEGNSFKDACEIAFGHTGIFNSKKMTYGGCRLFPSREDCEDALR